MKGRVTILGCGNSTGVPAVGNYWGACDPDDPKNRRLRPCALIEAGDSKLVIDTGPDFREQLCAADVNNVDAILYTHEHGDHTHGIDDLRVLAFRNKKQIPVYGNEQTLSELERRFHYLFKGGAADIYPPILEPHVIQDFGVVSVIEDVSFTPFEQDHGTVMSVGYRFGNFAYSTDVKTLDDDAVQTLKGIDIWVVDCAGYHDNQNKVHASIQQIYSLNEKIGAKTVYLTSLTLAMDYQTLKKELHDGYFPCHDGLVFEITL